jgi:protein-tyrosine phosphatase
MAKKGNRLSCQGCNTATIWPRLKELHLYPITQLLLDPTTKMDANDASSSQTAVLFVCLGNICRSPLAEGVFRHLIEQEGLADRFEIDSAGTGAWHVGERADARSTLVAEQHGITLDSRARQVKPNDFERFDYIIAMDRDNLRTLKRMSEHNGSGAHVELLRMYEAERDSDEVPDPYYGGSSGFENVYKMVKRSCQGLLKHLQAA